MTKGLTVDVVMPPLSQTADTLVLTAWLKRVGDAVVKGEALFEVETDKATLEVEAPATGTLHTVLVEPGTEVAAKTTLGTIALPPPSAPPGGQPMHAPPQPAPQAVVSPPSPAPGLPPERANRVLASPRARGLAQKIGLSLAGIPATGPGGLLVERDVVAFLASQQAANTGPNAPAPHLTPQADRPDPLRPSSPTTPAVRRVPLSPARRTLARRLAAAHQAAVPVTLTREVEATELVRLRQRLLAEPEAQAPRLTYTDLFISLAARCLAQHSTLNGTFDGEAVELAGAVHLSLAVDTDRGLLAPVLRDVGGQGLAAIAAARQHMVAAAHAGTLPPEAFTGGTFTLTNLGYLGVDAFTPVLNPPQLAILGVGRLRPILGAAGDRHVVWLSLTFDHRAVDGAPAARLLAAIALLIEKPERVWL